MGIGRGLGVARQGEEEEEEGGGRGEDGKAGELTGSCCGLRRGEG